MASTWEEVRGSFSQVLHRDSRRNIVDAMHPIAHRSLWSDTLLESQRATGVQLSGDISVDVVIVGAGLTGLWTAWNLCERDPALRVALVDRETVGFGASGRNGGWCSSQLPMSLTAIAKLHGASAAERMQRAMHATVRDVGQFVSDHGIDTGFERGGTIALARNQPQAERLQAGIEAAHTFGFTNDDYRWLSAGEASELCNATSVLGGKFTPHCASMNPLRLTHGVAAAVLAKGAQIYEHTTVEEIGNRQVRTDHGTISAEVVVRATEGYTSTLRRQRRDLLPIYSLMIATEPLPESVWSEIGLDSRPTFSDARNLIIYGQRTSEGRLAFGGRGAPYHFGSAVKSRYDTDESVCDLLIRTLWEMFPALRDTQVTHHWGGVLAAPRDWTCSVRFDRSTGFATAGGYVGDGLSTTHLAGRTLAALITESARDDDRELVTLPWVGHRSRRWEPEPLRWMGVNGARTAAVRADAAESRTGRRSKLWGGVINALLRR